MKLVVDASIGIKWFKAENEKNVDLAIGLLSLQLDNKIELIVPDLFFYEVLNILLIKTNFDLQDMRISLDKLIKLNMDIIHPDGKVTFSALNISKSIDLTFYDSLYLSVAQNFNAMLVTDDKKILQNKNDYVFIKNLEELMGM
ncbi:MAG: type II toxin-antitoxin system VapC family toxin [Cyanobacteria bacterium]|nr:type II toxin-antitoxin system VapC family toxin [Cyanobacteriota bacterium]